MGFMVAASWIDIVADQLVSMLTFGVSRTTRTLGSDHQNHQQPRQRPPILFIARKSLFPRFTSGVIIIHPRLGAWSNGARVGQLNRRPLDQHGHGKEGPVQYGHHGELGTARSHPVTAPPPHHHCFVGFPLHLSTN